MGRRFTSVLARLGTPTGDGRILSPGGISSRDLPLPLSWQEKSAPGHDGSVVIGRIESIETHQDMITATGQLLDVPDAWHAETLIEAGVIGPSLDLADDVTYVVDENDRTIITNAVFGGATLVPIEAFADVSITLDPLPAPRLEEMEPVAEDIEWALMASADVSRETLPPLEAFTNPGFTEYTHLTYEEHDWGTKVSGHIADWTSCHLGLPGCTTAPASFTGYAHFLTKEQHTADGTTVPVGVLTAGDGHADPRFGIRPAQDHYDKPELAVAKVFAGEDEHGIWVSGWILPYADPVRVQMLKDLDVSGDWRRTGGNLEMIAACAVNTGAYTQPRLVHFSIDRGGQQTLIGKFSRRPVDVSRETFPHAYARSEHSGAGNCECGMAEHSNVHPHAYAQADRSEGCVCSKKADDPIHTDPGPVTDSARAAWARASWRGKV